MTIHTLFSERKPGIRDRVPPRQSFEESTPSPPHRLCGKTAPGCICSSTSPSLFLVAAVGKQFPVMGHKLRVLHVLPNPVASQVKNFPGRVNDNIPLAAN